MSHIVEPAALLLTWQPSDEDAAHRTRRVVAEIVIDGVRSPVFRYLSDTEDFRAAIAAGFDGYPAFSLTTPETDVGVIEAFLRRLPPRKREDFNEFLALHRLPSPFPLSDAALLGYTGAKLPSDGFALVPVFDDRHSPCQYILEVAGFRYEIGVTAESLRAGDSVTLQVESDNRFDQDAVAISHNGVRIGYVNRALRHTFKRWLESCSVHAAVERINGKPERPLIYLRVEIDC